MGHVLYASIYETLLSEMCIYKPSSTPRSTKCALLAMNLAEAHNPAILMAVISPAICAIGTPHMNVSCPVSHNPSTFVRICSAACAAGSNRAGTHSRPVADPAGLASQWPTLAGVLTSSSLILPSSWLDLLNLLDLALDLLELTFDLPDLLDLTHSPRFCSIMLHLALYGIKQTITSFQTQLSHQVNGV